MKPRHVILLLCLLSTTSLFSQIVGDNVFLKGTYVEAGINSCGAYASSDAPPVGYHPTETGLSFVADRDMDGWATGSPNYCGDYAVPGSPVEGWGLQIGGDTWYNTDQGCSVNEIPGSITGYTTSPATITATWEGDLVVPNIHMTQLTVLNTADLYFVTTVTITNEGATTLSDIYYMRNIDPDNDQPWSGDFSTDNLVASNPPIGTDALVESSGLTYGCFLGIGARNADARATFGNFSTTDGTPSNVWHGEDGYTLEGEQVGDIATSIAFFIASIPAGGSATIKFAYIFSSDAEEAALAATGDFVCSSPTGITTDVSTTTASISWSPVPGATSYVVKYRPSAGGAWTTVPVAASPVEITGLTACTAYDYKISTICDGEVSAPTSGSFTTDCIPCASAPTGLFANNITTTSAKLHWNADPDAIKYKVSYGPVGGATIVVNAPTNSRNVGTLTPGTDYIFKVKSICADGSSSPYSLSAAFTTLLKLGDSPLENATLEVYPNPASDHMTVNIQNFNEGVVVLKLYDMIGNIILEQAVTITSNTITEELNISAIADGVYLLSAEQDGFSINNQIVVSK